MIQEFIGTLCNLVETLSNSLTVQYFEDNQQVWLLNTTTGNKLYMGNIYQMVERAKHQQIINETMGEI